MLCLIPGLLAVKSGYYFKPRIWGMGHFDISESENPHFWDTQTEAVYSANMNITVLSSQIKDLEACSDSG